MIKKNWAKILIAILIGLTAYNSFFNKSKTNNKSNYNKPDSFSISGSSEPTNKVKVNEKFNPLLTDNVLRWLPTVKRMGNKYNVDIKLILATIATESNGDPMTISKHNAYGLMQIKKETAEHMQIENFKHPDNNIECGVKYIAYLQQHFEGLDRILAAYNRGPTFIRENGIDVLGYDYIKKVKKYM